MGTRRYSYAILEWSGNDEDGYCEALISRHYTKAAAIKAERRAQREAEWLYDGEAFVVSCVYWEDQTQNYIPFSDRKRDYQICTPDQIGECALCRQRERPCYERYADGRCKRIAKETAGPWRVYALVDPNDGQTRYIGSTEKPLSKRLTQHICVKKGIRGRWIQSLLNQGQKPIIREIAQFDTSDKALQHEYHLINTLPGLTNEQRTHRAAGRVQEPK